MRDPLYAWQVRLTTPSAKDAAALIKSLQEEGFQCSRAFEEVFVSAEGQAEAETLAMRLRNREAVIAARAQFVGS
jgi:hypothetical protein